MKKQEDRGEENKYFLKAKKSLGQHFLRSDKAINQIVDNLEGETKIVFEIGPGEGVLTSKLLEKGFTVLVIEIDNRSIQILRQKFEREIENSKLFIINKDCLEVDYAGELEKIGKPYKYILVGNIPYYITGAIFRNTFEQKVLPEQAIFLVQKEVAQRIVASDKKESILSVSVKIFSEKAQDVKIIDVVKAGSFVPPPKVDSAIIAINNIKNPFENLEEQEIFFKILRACFSHKRKLLLTNLKTDLDENLYTKYFEIVKQIIVKNYKDKAEKVRAEDINLDTWLEIINNL